MSSVSTKACSKCKVQLPYSNFHQYKSGKREGKYWSECKECRYARLKEWRVKNPEAYKDNYYRGRLKYSYNLTPETLEQMKVDQNFQCKICDRVKRLAVDHCHTTGKVRGLLCFHCNSLLGHIENSVKMGRIKEYLS